MQAPEPQKEHHWLQRLVGDWDYVHDCQMGPDQPPMTSAGKQMTRSLGGLWIVGEITSDVPDGGEAHSIITLGYDPQARLFVGTFITSMMTHLWPYRGTLDAAGRVLTLDSEGPSFAGDGSLAKYQDIIEILDDDHHTMSSQFLSPAGEWVRFMEGRYTRKAGAAAGHPTR